MANPILTYKRIRVKFEASEYISQKDILTVQTPKMYRGNWARIEVIVYYNGEIVDLSNVTSLSLEIFRSNRTTRLASKTVSAASITAIPTAESWDAGTGQHAAFDFSGTELNWALTAGLTEENFFLVLSGVTNDTPGHDITYGTSTFTLVEDGSGVAGSPLVNDPLYFTQEEADARFFQKHADGASFVIKTGQHGYVYDPLTDLFYPLVVATVEGKKILTLGQEGESL